MARIGLMGCGSVADFGHLPAIRTTSDLEIVALFDPIPGRVLAYSEKFGGLPSLTAVLVITTGIVGATAARYVFERIAHRRSQRARLLGGHGCAWHWYREGIPGERRGGRVFRAGHGAERFDDFIAAALADVAARKFSVTGSWPAGRVDSASWRQRPRKPISTDLAAMASTSSLRAQSRGGF